MSAPIGPGDYVECITDGIHCCARGAVYVVAQVWTAAGPCDCHAAHNVTAFYLEGVTPPEPWGSQGYGWCSLNFRPIYRRDETLLSRLLTDIPEDEFHKFMEDA